METVNNEGYIVTKSIDDNAITELKISMPIDIDGKYESPSRADLQQISDAHIAGNLQNDSIISQGRTIYQTDIKCSVFALGPINILLELPIYELKIADPISINVVPESKCKTNIIADMPWDFHNRNTNYELLNPIIQMKNLNYLPPIQIGYSIREWEQSCLWGMIKENEEGRRLQSTCLDAHNACIPSMIVQIVKIPFSNQFYRIDYTEVLQYAINLKAVFEINENDEFEQAQSEISLIDGFNYDTDSPITNKYPIGTKMVDATIRYPGSSNCLVTSGTYLYSYVQNLTVVNLGNASVLLDEGIIKMDLIDYYDGIYDDYNYNEALDDCLITFEIISGFYFQCSRLKLGVFREIIWDNWVMHYDQNLGQVGCRINPQIASEIDYRNDEFIQDIYAYSPIKQSEIQDFPCVYSEFAGAIGEFSYSHEGGAKKLNRPYMYKQGNTSEENEYEHTERDDLLLANIIAPRPKNVFQRLFSNKKTKKPGRDYAVLDIYKSMDQYFDSVLQPIVHKQYRNHHAIGDEYWTRPLQMIQDLDLDLIKSDLGISTTCLLDGNQAYAAAIDAGLSTYDAEKSRQLVIRKCFFGEKVFSHRGDGPIYKFNELSNDHKHRHMHDVSFDNIVWKFENFVKEYNMTINQFENMWNKLYVAAEPWLESNHMDIDCDDLMRYGALAIEAIDSETKSINQNFKRFLAETLVRVKFNLGVPAYPKFIKFTQESVFYTQGVPSIMPLTEQPLNSELKCTFDPITIISKYNKANDISFNYSENNIQKIPVSEIIGTYAAMLPVGMSRPSLKLKGKMPGYSLQLFTKSGKHLYGNTHWDTAHVVENNPGIFDSDAVYDVSTLNTNNNIKRYIHDGSTIDVDEFTYINDMGYKVSHVLLPYEEFIFIDEVLLNKILVIIVGPESIGGVELTAEWTKLFCNWVDKDDDSIIIAPAPTDLIGEIELPYNKVWHENGWAILPHMSKYSSPAGTPAKDIRGTKYEKYVDDIYKKCFHTDVIIADPTVEIVDRLESTTWTPMNGDKHLYSDVIPGKVHQIHVLNYCNRIVYEHERQGFIEDETRTGGSICHYNDMLSRKSGEIIWTRMWYDSFDLTSVIDCGTYCVDAADSLYKDAVNNGISFSDAYSMKTDYLANCIAGFDSTSIDCYFNCWKSANDEEQENITNGMSSYDASMIKAIKIASCYGNCNGGYCFSTCMTDALDSLVNTTIINNGSYWDGILAYSKALLNCTNCNSKCISNCKDTSLKTLAARIEKGDDEDIATVEVASDYQNCGKGCNPPVNTIPAQCSSVIPHSGILIDCILDLYTNAALHQKKYGDVNSPDYDPQWKPIPIDTSGCIANTFKCSSDCQFAYAEKIKQSIAAGYTMSEALALHSYALSDCMFKCGESDCSSSCIQSQKLAIFNASNKPLELALDLGVAAFNDCLKKCSKGTCLSNCAEDAKIIGLQALIDGKSENEAADLMQESLDECNKLICGGSSCVNTCIKPWTIEWLTVSKEGGDPDKTWGWYLEKLAKCEQSCNTGSEKSVTVQLKLYNMSQIGYNQPQIVNIEKMTKINYILPEPMPTYIVRILPEIIDKKPHPYHILPRMIWYEILKISLQGGWPREIHAKTIPSRATSHYKFFMPEKVQFEENRTRFFSKSSKYQRTLQIKSGASLLNKSTEGILNDYLSYLDGENWTVSISSTTPPEKTHDILFLSNLSVIGYWDKNEIFDKIYKGYENSLLAFMNVSKLNYILIKPDMNKYTETDIKEMYMELTKRITIFFGNAIKIGIIFDVDFNKNIIKELYNQPAVNKIIFDCSSDEEIAEIWDKHGDMAYSMDIVLYVNLTKVKDYRIQLMFDRWLESFNFNEIFLKDANTFAMSQEWIKMKNGVGI